MTLTEPCEVALKPAADEEASAAVACETAQSALEDTAIFREWAGHFYEADALRHYDAAIARMLLYLAPPPGSLVLDAGCGTGVHAVRVARAGFDVVGIDVSTAALELALRHVSEEGIRGRITLERGSVTDLPFEDGQFSTAFSWGALAHIPDVDRALAELVRVIRNGGRIALQVTNNQAWDHWVEAIARRMLRKPQPMERSAWGLGRWDESDAGRLWTWRLNVRAIARHMQSLGCRLVHHGPSEFTELQRHARGLVRTGLRRLNRMWFACRLPAQPACTNLLVFEKEA